MTKTFTTEDLLTHAADMMDRITANAAEQVQQWLSIPASLPEMLAVLDRLHADAAAYHGFILSLFAKNDLLLNAEGAIPLDPRADQLDRDFQALMLSATDAARPAATATVQ